MKGIIASATSDIATEMCLHCKKKGWDLYGTYYSSNGNYKSLVNHKIPLLPCDFSKAASADDAAHQLSKIASDWDFILFATGSQVPIGLFEKVNINDWIHSIELNYLNQLRFLHRLLQSRDHSKEKTVLFFAGGGTNNPVNHYSAYTLSKVGLIKTCELLDSEIEDIKFSIIGPGWVKTRIHNATIECGEEWAGKNFEKTKQKLASNDCVPIANVIHSFEWVLSQPKKIVGGRNFSTVFDQWGTQELTNLLAGDENMYKLRRHKNDALVNK